MEDQLADCQTATHELTEQATEPLPPLESFVGDDFTGAHADIGLLKATFDCVSRTLPPNCQGLGCVSDK